MAVDADNSTTIPLVMISWLQQHAASMLRRQLFQDGTSTPTLEFSSGFTAPPMDTSETRGRTVLTILYLCILALCFIVPVFYYFRLHCFEEQVRRELEQFDAEGFHAALEQSENHREESRAVRRKYIEERRARILQLCQPVRMTLKEENFPHLMGEDVGHPTDTPVTAVERPAPSFKVLKGNYNLDKSRSDETMTVGSGVDDDNDDDDDEEAQRAASAGAEVVNDRRRNNNTDKDLVVARQQMDDHVDSHTYGDDDNLFVRLPVPGLQSGACRNELLFRTTPKVTSCSNNSIDSSNNSSNNNQNSTVQMRLVPGLCTICLCTYKVGSDVVWSSNEACEHVFHKGCIEQWLMKQREGPLCPCCRRDFIVDPFDLEDMAIEFIGAEEGGGGDGHENNDTNSSSSARNQINDEESPQGVVWQLDIEMNLTAETEATPTAAGETLEHVTVVALPSDEGDQDERNATATSIPVSTPTTTSTSGRPSATGTTTRHSERAAPKRSFFENNVTCIASEELVRGGGKS